eukprot:jgi/Mesen1/5802/ME000293S04965
MQTILYGSRNHPKAPPPTYPELPPGFDAELKKLFVLLPESIREQVEEHPDVEVLLEIVLDLGRRPLARFPGGDWNISDGLVASEDLEFAVSQVGEFGGDNRAGIDRTLHRISAIRNRAGRIVGLTCRVGRAISGSAEMVRDLVAGGGSLLLMGPPGGGAVGATPGREIARLLADDHLRRVVIVDTSNEIGGDGDIPHVGIGRARRMQVPQVEMQHEIMIEAVENHMPQTVVIDEIGTELEAVAAGTIAQRGVQLVGTAHGMTVENLVKNPSLQNLAGGIQSVTLGDDEARRRGVQKSVLERKGPPVFTSAVEMISRWEWRVHHSLAATVDALLAGEAPGAPGGAHNAFASPGGSDSEGDEDGSASESESDYGLLDSFRDEMMRPDPDDAAPPRGSSGSLGAEPWRREDGPFLLYTYQVAEAPLEQVMEVMGLVPSVRITTDIGAADAVLALRSKLKHNAWSNTMAQMVRAMRAMLGMDSLGSQGLLSTSASTGRSADSSTGASGDDDEPRWQAEARSAIEQIVIPRNQPVELLPRAAHILDLQAKLVEGYQLEVQRAGADASCRLRVLPRHYKQPRRPPGGPNRSALARPEDILDGPGPDVSPESFSSAFASSTSTGAGAVVSTGPGAGTTGSPGTQEEVESDAASGLSVSRLPVLED